MLNSLLTDQYKEYVGRQDHALFSSSLLFCNFIISLMPVPEIIPFYFMVMDDKDRICGVLPSFVCKGKYGSVLNSMPWYGSNPGVLSDNHGVFYLLLDAFNKTAEWLGCASSTIVTRPFEPMSDYFSYYSRNRSDRRLIINSRTGMMTPLPEYSKNLESDLFNLFDSKTRNQIRKGYKETEIFSCDYMTDIQRNSVIEWTRLKHQENMIRLGAPSKDKEFDLFKTWDFGKDINIFVAATPEDSKPQAALLLKYFNKTVDYCIPVIDVEYRHSCAMNACIMTAMKDATEKGYRWWNWGGTNKETMPGVYHFKKNFGGVECQYNYFTTLYDDNLLDIPKEELWAEYPFFFVLPYDLLNDRVKTRG
jgi:hypothetical protein